MTTRARAAPAAVVLALLACACQTDDSAEQASAQRAAAGGSEVVARVGGEPITAAELDEWIRQDLFRQATRDHQPSRVYDLRARSLDRLIEERVMAAETRRRGVDTEELIRQELETRGGVSEEEIARFYEENRAQMGGASLDDLRGRIRTYLERERADQIVAELRERAGVDVLLEPVRLEVAADGPSLGPANAHVTIVEFSDFQCPYCKKAGSVLKEVMQQFPEDVRLVYRHLPLSGHSRARPAAEASVCADGQGRFWAYHDVLFANEQQLSDQDLRRYAGDLGLDLPSFEQCLAAEATRDRVEHDLEAARAAGISSTPTFLVNGVVVSGAQPASAFVQVIESELGRSKTGS